VKNQPEKNHQKSPRRHLKIIFLSLVILSFSIVGGFSLWKSQQNDSPQYQQKQLNDSRLMIAHQLGPQFQKSEFPAQASLKWDGSTQKVSIQYTFLDAIQEEAQRLLKIYKPDYAAVVVMDAQSGRIYAIASFDKNNDYQESMALRGSYPAASIFKVVTATAALDKYNLDPEQTIRFNGGNHTLYRKNVMSEKQNRWTRTMSLREAFARSINTVFGRLTFEYMQPQDLEEYALRFGFNKKFISDLPYEQGHVEVPKEKTFELAEVASGYNRRTKMSPVQGAMIAGSIADDGWMKLPYVVESIQTEKGENLFQSQPLTMSRTMSAAAAEKVRILMEETIHKGTSRKSFRTFVRSKKFNDIQVGGKTGFLHGEEPAGKVDWFVGFGSDGRDKISIAAITVNKQFWTVKASYLAQSLFKKYYGERFNEENHQFVNQEQESQE
jgi:peptidoglycan glycosyltransferase